MEELKWIEAMLKEINNFEFEDYMTEEDTIDIKYFNIALNFRRDYLLKEFAK